jgi:glyoxylase-like metal-dependent hydrolase (beta-lactamase superfamily II)
MKTNRVKDIEIIQLPTNWPVGPVNLYLIKGEKLTLVDAGRRLEKAWILFHDALEQRGMTIMDIEQVVLTHHHTDHIGLLDWLLEKNPIPVFAHPNCRPYLTLDESHFKRAREFFTAFYRENGAPKAFVEKLALAESEFSGLRNKVETLQDIDEGASIPGLSEWKVIETKGHAQSHISLYRPKDEVFLSGDHLIKHTPAGIFLDPPIFPETIRSKPLIQYMNNLRKCLAFPVSLTFSGHGEPIEDVRGLIQKTLENIEKRAQKVKNLLYGCRKNAYQLIQVLYPDRYEREVSVLLSDMVSLLDLLADRNEICQEEENGVLYYSVNRY